MIWLDPTAQFRRQFQPCDQGFLYYPKRKGGGKLISQAEYDGMVRTFRRWVGARFRPGLCLPIMFGAVLALALIALAIPMPEIVMQIVVWLMLAGFLIGYFWLYSAPRRLVRDRPEITPPRTKDALGRDARARFTWPIIAFGIGLSACLAFIGLTAPPSIGAVVWTAVWAAVFVLYVKIAVQKFGDPKG